MTVYVVFKPIYQYRIIDNRYPTQILASPTSLKAGRAMLAELKDRHMKGYAVTGGRTSHVFYAYPLDADMATRQDPHKAVFYLILLRGVVMEPVVSRTRFTKKIKYPTYVSSEEENTFSS